MELNYRNNWTSIFVFIFLGTPILILYGAYLSGGLKDKEMKTNIEPKPSMRFSDHSVPEKFLEKVPEKLFNEMESCYRGHKHVDITVVTLYINIGKFQKGGSQKNENGNHRDAKSYMSWMDTWAWLNNTVVAYFDDQNILDHFRKIRSRQPADRTKAYLITRDQLPAFRDLETVRRIYAQPGYPQHYPNTVNPLYSVTMNAKWDALDRFLTTEPLTTKYIAWLDVGCFRQLMYNKQITDAKKTYTFKIEVPPKFDDSTVSYSKISDRESFFKGTTPWEIIKHNRVWVSGAYFVATKPAIEKYVEDYRSAVQDLLAQNMSSTDQQVIASLHSRQLPTKPSVEIKPNTCKHGNPWFCMAYKCKETAESRDLYCNCDT